MPDHADLPSVLSAAAAAAEAGDYVSAEARLREAADLQESTLGPIHPDLANTLNNLAVVCETTGKTSDAERFYRRAHEIAAKALEPDHPFVTTSRNNLRDFCEARGLPIDLPKPAPALPPPPPSPAAAIAPPTPVAAPEAPASEWSSRSLVTAVLVGGALIVLVILATRSWPPSSGSVGSPQVESRESSEDSPPPAAPASAGVTDPAAAGPATTDPPRIEATPTQPSTPEPEPVDSAPKRAPARAGQPEVAEADMCLSLSTQGATWECEPATASTRPGRRVFYTRIRTSRDTTVEHRWYQGSRLRQAVELRVLTNLGPGYRTYSQFTIGSDSPGDWRVELRDRDGVLLHEERFVVR